MNRENNRKNRMKNLLRLFASLAGFLDPRRVHSIKTGRASGKSCRKSLIINDPILHPPSKSSGNVRFCAFTAPTFPEPIRSNPKFRAETCASGLAGAEDPNGNTGLNGRCNTHATPPKSLHRVALCCSVLHRVSPKNLSDLRCNTFAFPIEPVHGGTAGMRPPTGVLSKCSFPGRSFWLRSGG